MMQFKGFHHWLSHYTILYKYGTCARQTNKIYKIKWGRFMNIWGIFNKTIMPIALVGHR